VYEASKSQLQEILVEVLLAGADPLAPNEAGVTPTEVVYHMELSEIWEAALHYCGPDNRQQSARDGEATGVTTSMKLSIPFG
jgi:hypothetical protein